MEDEFGAVPVELHVAELVDDQEVRAPVAGDRAGQVLVGRGLGEFVREFRREGVLHGVTLLGGAGSEGEQEVGLPGAGVSDQAQRVAARSIRLLGHS